MAYMITDECIACGSVKMNVLVEAISEGDEKVRSLIPNCVNDCGACADQCPRRGDYSRRRQIVLFLPARLLSIVLICFIFK